MKYLLAWLLPTVLAVVLIDIGLGFNETATSAPVTPMTICEEPDCETTPPPTTPPPTTPPPTTPPPTTPPPTTTTVTTPPPTTVTTTTTPPPSTVTTTTTPPPSTATVCCVPPPPTRSTHPAPPTGYDAGLTGTEEPAVLGPNASPSFWSIIGFGAGLMLIVAGVASMILSRRIKRVGR